MNGFKRSIMSLTTVSVVAVLGLVCAAGAQATSATATLSAGSLAFLHSTPAAVSFSGTLTGQDMTVSNTQAMDVGDATGSGAGWNITATSTTFTNGTQTLATTTTTINSAPTDTCDASSSCALATNSVTYPYTLPASGTAPTATKLFNAASGSGMGDQTVTPTWTLAIPSSTYAGTYTSTWTISLVSAP
jgi:hypothetical protein